MEDKMLKHLQMHLEYFRTAFKTAVEYRTNFTKVTDVSELKTGEPVRMMTR